MKALDAMRAGQRYWRAGHRLGLPLQVGFAVNNICNTFCQMCNIWKMKPKSQLALADIGKLFGNPLFQNCVTASLTGGEPTMRADFGEVPIKLAEVMPSLGRVALTSNGYATQKIVEQFSTFLPVLAERGISFSANFSIDGVGEVHNRIRNNKRAWGHLVDTLDELAALQDTYNFNMVLACTLSRENASDAPNVLDFAKRRGLYVIFRNATTIARIGNREDYGSFALGADQLEELKRFYTSLLADYDRSHARRRYYSMLLSMMDAADRSVPCLYRKAGLFVDHLGDMYVCTVFSEKLGNALERDPLEIYLGSEEHRQELGSGACAGCSHDVSLYLPTRSQAWDRARSAVTKVQR